MTTAAEYIDKANRILNPRPDDRHKPRDERLREADVHARLATATALDAMARQASAEAQRPTLSFPSQQPWPDGVTARLVTRMGQRLSNPEATVDITTHPGHGHLPTRLSAACRPCGWSLDRDDNHNKVLAKAQDHADGCTALPNPTV